MIAGHRDGVEPGKLLCAVLHDVCGKLQRGLYREDVVAAGNVLLEDIVLNGAGQLVRVDSLAAFFPKGENPVFVVRNMSGPELAKIKDTGLKRAAYKKLMEGIVSDRVGEKVAAIREASRQHGFAENV